MPELMDMIVALLGIQTFISLVQTRLFRAPLTNTKG